MRFTKHMEDKKDNLKNDIGDAKDNIAHTQNKNSLTPNDSYIIDSHNENNTPTYNFKWMIALLLVGMAGSFLFPSIRNMQPRNHIIYTDNFDTFPDIITDKLRNLKETNKSELIEAMSFYNQGKYGDAISLYEDYEGSQIIKSEAKFYQAISLLANSRIGSANEILQKLSQDKYISEVDDAILWYLGLSYLKLGKLNNVKTLFNLLPANHYKYEEAQNILSQIE